MKELTSTPYWQMPPQKTDVLIIGGGLMGTSIAYHLAKKDIHATLIEAKTLAAGASGRNDGQIILETADYYHRMQEVYGADQAKQILFFKRSGQTRQESFLQPFKHLPQLAFHKQGSLTLAYNDAEAKMIEKAVEVMSKDGFETTLVNQDQIDAMIQTRYFQMGKLDQHDASINPSALTHLTAAEAQRQGATIIEHCPVSHVESGKVKHIHGETEADLIILATNAYTASLLPNFEPLVFPIRGQVLATDPIPGISIPAYACITNFGYDYWHWTEAGELILGGRRFIDEHGETGTADVVNPKVQQALEDFGSEMYPQFAPFNINKRWSGIMGFSKDGKPIIGPIDGDPTLWCAVGFTGYGLGMCWSVGEAVAEVLNDEQSELTECLPIFSPNRFKSS